MYLGKRILAVVPARSGSKGVVDKNIKPLKGISLIGRAGICLNHLEWIDTKVISTDSVVYTQEGNKYNLESPFIRPGNLSGDRASAVDTIIHALLESENKYNLIFDVVLIIEPTSPLRRPEDIENTLNEMLINNAESSVCVSPLSTKYHPVKALKVTSGKLSHLKKMGEKVIARQQLNPLYIRNGVCYAVSRNYLLEYKSLFSDNTRPYVIQRNVVNIDEPIDFLWAEFLMRNESNLGSC